MDQFFRGVSENSGHRRAGVRIQAARVDFPDELSRAFRYLTKSLLAFLQSLLGVLSLCDVDTRAYVPQKLAIGSKARNTSVQQRPILTVMPPQAVLHRELTLRVECVRIDAQAAN